MKKTPKQIAARIGFYVLLVIFLVFILFPMYWCLVTSFKYMNEIVTRPPTFFPKNFTFSNYVDAWVTSRFSVFFKNSFYISVLGTLMIVLVSILTGYALDRFKFKGKGLFMLILLCTQFIPGAVLITPMFLIFKNIGMLNNLFAIALVDVTFQFPFNSILMRGFINGIDYTIEEAAQIDGCSRMGGIIRVLLPLLKPAIATIAAYGFIHCWNEFLFSFMFISKEPLKTLPVGLKSLVGEFSVNFGTLAAGATIAVIPTLILFSYVQKNLVSGLSSGAVKG